MAQNDVQLIRRILQGDQNAFSGLVKKYQKGTISFTLSPIRKSSLLDGRKP